MIAVGEVRRLGEPEARHARKQHRQRDGKLRPRHERAARLLARLPRATVVHVPRERNRLADALAAEALAAGLEDGGWR